MPLCCAAFDGFGRYRTHDLVGHQQAVPALVTGAGMSPQAAATGTAALVLSALLALAVAQQEPVCYEPAQPSAQAKLVRFGSGELYVPPGPNGKSAVA